MCCAVENEIDFVALCEMPMMPATDIKGYHRIRHVDERNADIDVYAYCKGDFHYFKENSRYSLLRSDALGINLVVMHLNALMYPKATDYQINDLNRALSDVDRIELRYGDKRTIILGDLNFGLFDDKMLAFNNLNACLFKYQVADQKRTMREEQKDIYYNPMLQVYRDNPDGSVPKGTFYYYNAEPAWHCYDHILVKYPLVEAFDDKSLRIINQIGKKYLVKNNKTLKQYSDHLPIVFQLNLKREA